MTLVESHWGLVMVVVNSLLKIKKYSKYRAHKDDLIGVAALALTEAERKFDPTRGVQFKTYASARMRGDLYSEIQRLAVVEYHEVHIEEYSNIADTKEERKDEGELYDLVDSLEPEGEYEKAIYWRTIIGDGGIKPIAKEFHKGVTTTRTTRNKLLKQLEEKLTKENK